MNSSNGFNICPRCGNSNSLNAKYCSRCGAQLKVPTEAVVCHKCHTRNSSLANFCRNCGATLKVGAQTKICPRCGREIGAEENMCACGYSFVTLQQTEPRYADVSSTNKDRKKDKKHDKNKSAQPSYAEPTAMSDASGKQPKKKKGGRGFALVALLFIAVFVYFIIAPATLRGPLSKFDKGYYFLEIGITTEGVEYKDKDIISIEKTVTDDEGNETKVNVDISTASGYSMLRDAFNLLFKKGALNEDMSNIAEIENATIYDSYRIYTDAQQAAEQEPISIFAFYKMTYGWGGIVAIVLVALFLLTALVHVLSCIIRLIAPRRSKHCNWLYLALAFLTTLLAVGMICAHFFAEKEGFLNTIYNFLTPQNTFNPEMTVYYNVGYAVAFIPVAYWILWLYSCIAKKKAPKKEKKDKKNA